MSFQQSASASQWKPSVRRRRVGLSCLVCKLRKVRCDRQTPVCKRCTLNGTINQCSYDHEGFTSSRPDSPLGSAQQTTQDTGLRVEDCFASSAGESNEAAAFSAETLSLEQLTNGSIHTQQTASNAEAMAAYSGLQRHQNDFSSSSTLSPRAFENTAFDNLSIDFGNETDPLWSSTSVTSVPAHPWHPPFHGASNSLTSAVDFPGLADVVKSTTNQYARSTSPLSGVSKPTSPDRIQIDHSTALSTSIQRLLPPEFRCRQLMQTYFTHFDMMYRILHAPDFWKTYREYWADPHKCNKIFPYILATAISCARCLKIDNPPLFDFDTSLAAKEATIWLKLAEAWLEQQSYKHINIETIQLRCLLMVAKRMSIVKMKRHYEWSQGLLAIAISTGLQKEIPHNFDVLSAYEMEIRRRIWWCVTEVELAEAIDRGVPSLVENLDADIEAPSNILDTQLDRNSAVLPSSHPDENFTECSLARFSRRVQPLRYMINTLANSPTTHVKIALSDLQQLHAELVQHLEEVAICATFYSGDRDSSAIFLCRSILELNLHEALLLLHLPFAFGTRSHSHHQHSRFICQGSSCTTIDIMSRIHSRGLSQLCVSRTYLQRASLVLCRLDATAPLNSMLYHSLQNTDSE